MQILIKLNISQFMSESFTHLYTHFTSIRVITQGPDGPETFDLLVDFDLFSFSNR